ncbi:hypothetical protein [Breznakiella homolactica]|uniref:Uncharacterized protein n=1 Tax=Breznakiella homolactica TaxID=2798577 RepID=A0A7T7XJJ0_9SPIR|nr:hypothetical protein [Breznakiella homolactica]QQO07531.1 hypothetical protein JFL75_11275 [Breznakiella homolactica]
MNLTINGEGAEITLESEETLGELLSGLEDWLAGSGYSLSGITINNEKISAGSIGEVFDRKLSEIDVLDIQTSNLFELLLEALIVARDILEAYREAAFDSRQEIQQDWEGSAAASFLSHRNPELFGIIDAALSGEGLSPDQVLALTDERIAEISAPQQALLQLETIIDGVSQRLEDLPLDLQTGKDSRATETVQLFSNITEKLFRLMAYLNSRGFEFEYQGDSGATFDNFFEGFDATIKEMLAAYEAKDAVLVGDLAEYELAPRLRLLFGILKKSAEKTV